MIHMDERNLIFRRRVNNPRNHSAMIRERSSALVREAVDEYGAVEDHRITDF